MYASNREYILGKGNFGLYQSDCVHNGVSRNREHDAQDSTIILLDDLVKYYGGLRKMEENVSLSA